MNMRHVRWGIDIFTGLTVVSVGVALAGLSWRLAGYSGTLPVAAATSNTASAPVEIGGLLALAPFGAVEAPSDAASDGSLHLKGILLAVPASASVALIAGSDGKVAGYGIGAALGGGVVEAIAADQVVVRTPRGLQTVVFSPAATGPAAATLGAAGKGTGFVPAAAAAEPARANAAGNAAPGAAALPPPGGFVIGDSAPAALLAAGLRRGDIVQEVNGAPVSAGMSADAIGHQLAGAALLGGAAQVVVLRDGNRVSLHLAIH